MSLNKDEKEFLRNAKLLIIDGDWLNFIDMLYSNDTHIDYDYKVNQNKILNLLDEVGVDYKNYPKFKIGERVYISDVTEILDINIDMHNNPAFIKKYSDKNFVFASNINGTIKDILPLFNAIYSFVYVVEVKDNNGVVEYSLVNQNGLGKI